MLKDEYGEVINGKETYEDIASNIGDREPLLFGWTDGQGTHFDILIVYRAYCENSASLQGGIRPSDLFVSIMRVGAFGFEVNDLVKHPGYIAEKLGVRLDWGLGTTAKALADLITGVIAELQKT